jgi:hypothetical protein
MSLMGSGAADWSLMVRNFENVALCALLTFEVDAAFVNKGRKP